MLNLRQAQPSSSLNKMNASNSESDREVLAQLNAEYLASDQFMNVERYMEILAEDCHGSRDVGLGDEYLVTDGMKLRGGVLVGVRADERSNTGRSAQHLDRGFAKNGADRGSVDVDERPSRRWGCVSPDLVAWVRRAG
jgi:hypothetical protein